MPEEKDENRASRGSQRYKFMTNILANKNQRTKYIKSLERFTRDPDIPYLRIVIALFAAFVLTSFVLYYILNDFTRLPFVIIQCITFWISSMVIIIIAMLPSRKRSMLYSVLVYYSSRFSEKLRRENGAEGDLSTMGISKVEQTQNGLLLTLNEESYDGYKKKAYAYVVEGFLGRSVLPAVADDAANARKDYLIARSPTCANKMLTSIKEVDVDSQLAALRDHYNKISNYPNMNKTTKQWLKHQVEMQYASIQAISEQEFMISQVFFIIENDEPSLMQEALTWENHALNAYSHFEKINTRKELVDRLKDATSTSNKGIKLHSKEDKPINQFEKQ